MTKRLLHVLSTLQQEAYESRNMAIQRVRDEQAVRLQARLDDPNKRWKFRPEDLADRARWDGFMDVYGEAISETSTDHAPDRSRPVDDHAHEIAS